MRCSWKCHFGEQDEETVHEQATFRRQKQNKTEKNAHNTCTSCSACRDLSKERLVLLF